MSDNDISCAIELTENGKSISEISEKLDKNYHTIAYHLRKKGLTTKGKSEELIDEAEELYDSGMSLSEVADELGENKSTIGSRLKKRGVTDSVSEALEGRDITWSDKIADALRGRELSRDTRQKISEANKGKDSWSEGMRKEENPEIMKNIGKSGEDHWAWKGGVSEKRNRIRQSSEYNNWRDSVFERDNYTCQKCGDDSGGNLNAHHIKPFSEYEETRFDVDNGVTMCRSCHMDLHNSEGEYSPEEVKQFSENFEG